MRRAVILSSILASGFASGCRESEPAFSRPPVAPPDAVAHAGGHGGGAMRPLADVLPAAPAAVTERYVLSLSPDRVQLTIDPRPQARRDRAMPASGFTSEDSANGGKILSLAGGPFRFGAWLSASLRDRVASAERRAELERAGYDLDAVRDILVVDGEHDLSPTMFAFSNDATKPGIVGICHDVTVLDFGKPDPRPIAVRKPVLYLDPPEAMRVHVRVVPAGGLTTSYPAHGDAGWVVDVAPGGRMHDTVGGRDHDYLFWEARTDRFALDPARAHSVPRDEAAGFLEQLCEHHALDTAECGDFVTYWLPELERHPHNLVEVVDRTRYDAYAPLHVTPAPDTTIRLFVLIEGSDAPRTGGAPALPRLRRSGFTVVEWGGAAVPAAARVR